MEVRSRIQAGANAWSTDGQRDIQKLKGNVLDSCVVPSRLLLCQLLHMACPNGTMREQLDKENSRCNDSGVKENDISKRRSWNEILYSKQNS